VGARELAQLTASGKFFDVAFENGDRRTLLRRLEWVQSDDPAFLTFLLTDGHKIVIGKKYIMRMEEVP